MKSDSEYLNNINKPAGLEITEYVTFHQMTLLEEKKSTLGKLLFN